MIDLNELELRMSEPIELVLVYGSDIVANIISVDAHSDPEILYEVLKVLSVPRVPADRPGALLGVAASEVLSWRIYTGPLD